MNTPEQTCELTEKERRLVKRAGLLSRLVIPGVVTSLILPFLWLLLVMIGDIAHGAGMKPLGLWTFVILEVFCFILFGYGYIRLVCLLRGKKWRALAEKANTNQNYVENAAAVSTATGTAAAGRLMEMSDNQTVSNLGTATKVVGSVGTALLLSKQMKILRANIDAVAERCGIKRLSVKKCRAAVMLTAGLLLIGAYLLCYKQGDAEIEERAEVMSAAMGKIETVFRQDYDVTKSDLKDPMASSFRIRCDSKKVPGAYVTMNFNKAGVIYDITHSVDLLADKTPEENLKLFQEFLYETDRLLASAKVEMSIPELRSQLTIPEAFKEEFLSGAGQEDARVSDRDKEVSRSCSFRVGQSDLSPSYFYYGVTYQ